jgi:hypothetical protein
MKSVEVLADFLDGDIKIITLAFEGEVYRVSSRRQLPSDKFENKKLRYFRIKSDNNIFIISFDSKTLDWKVVSYKLGSKKKK